MMPNQPGAASPAHSCFEPDFLECLLLLLLLLLRSASFRFSYHCLPADGAHREFLFKQVLSRYCLELLGLSQYVAASPAPPLPRLQNKAKNVYQEYRRTLGVQRTAIFEQNAVTSTRSLVTFSVLV